VNQSAIQLENQAESEGDSLFTRRPFNEHTWNKFNSLLKKDKFMEILKHKEE